MDAPTHFYKFYSNTPDYLMSALDSGICARRFFLSGASEFNDLFEVRPAFIDSSAEEVEEAYRKYAEFLVVFVNDIRFREAISKFLPVLDPSQEWTFDPSEFAKLLLSSRQQYDTMLMLEFTLTRFFCFSASWESRLMWGHYANSYRGVCVEYEIDQQKFGPAENPALEVVYDAERPRYTVPYFVWLWVRYNAKKLGLVEGPVYHQDYPLMPFFLTKDVSWKYEKEYRVVVHPNARPKDNMIELPYLTAKSIILGPRVPAEKIRELKSRYSKCVQFDRLLMHQNEFRLLRTIDDRNG